MALSWKAESKDRKDVVLEGKTTTQEHKLVLSKIKQILVKAAEAGTANKGEKFKVSIIENGKTTDAWVMVAKPPRSAGKVVAKGKVTKAVEKKAEKSVVAKKATVSAKKASVETATA